MKSLFVYKESFMHRLDPRTKMVMLLAGIFCSFIVRDTGQLMTLIIIMLPMVFMGKIFKEYIFAMFVLNVFTGFIIFIQGIFGEMGVTPLFTLFGVFNYKYESLEYALRLSLRIYSIGTATTIFVTTTHPSDIAGSLIKLGVPHSVAFMVLSTFQLIPILQREASIIIQAQMARCLDVKGSISKRIKNLIPLFAPLFIITFMKIHQLSQVMECRGFSNKVKKTSLRERELKSADYIFGAIIILVLLYYSYIRMYAINLTNANLLIYMFTFFAIFIPMGIIFLLLPKLKVKSRVRRQA